LDLGTAAVVNRQDISEEPDTMRLAICTLLLLPAGIGLEGCSRNPSLDITGSFFPAWMLSISKRFFLSARIDPYLTPHLLVYGALMISFTLLTWLLLYW
jgi:YtcA family